MHPLLLSTRSPLAFPYKLALFAGGKVRPQLGDDPQEALSLEINCWDLFMGSSLAYEMLRARERKRERESWPKGISNMRLKYEQIQYVFNLFIPLLLKC